MAVSLTLDCTAGTAKRMPRPHSQSQLMCAKFAPPPVVRRSSSENHLGSTEDLDPPPSSFFFTGCAWGCAYHVGAYRGLVERWGLTQLKACKFGGNSAGSIMALAGAVGASWELLEETYLELAESAADRGVMFKMSEYHSAALDKLVGPTTHAELAGRLFVGVTYAEGFEVHSSFASRDELLNTLCAAPRSRSRSPAGRWARCCLASSCTSAATPRQLTPNPGVLWCDTPLCASLTSVRACVPASLPPLHRHASMHIPFYCTHLAPVGGRSGVDGGLSAPYYQISDDTLIIDPFGSSSLASLAAAIKLEPLFPILGARYAQVHSEGRKAILGRVQPGALALNWPSPCHAAMWFGRGVEEVAYGLARALSVWRIDALWARHGQRLRVLALALLLVCWLSRRSRRRTKLVQFLRV